MAQIAGHTLLDVFPRLQQAADAGSGIALSGAEVWMVLAAMQAGGQREGAGRRRFLQAALYADLGDRLRAIVVEDGEQDLGQLWCAVRVGVEDFLTVLLDACDRGLVVLRVTGGGALRVRVLVQAGAEDGDATDG